MTKLEQMAQTARMIQDLQKLGIIGVYDGFHNNSSVKFQVTYNWFKENINNNYFVRSRGCEYRPYELVYLSSDYEIISVLDMAEYDYFKTWEVK